MPRSRSWSIESMTRSETSSCAAKTPDWRSMASTRVVLPWSTCAMIATLRMSLRAAMGATERTNGQQRGSGDAVGDRSKRRQARHEQVLAAACSDERRLRGEEERRGALHGHLRRAGAVPEDVVLVVAEVEDVAVVQPLDLDALELPRDARVEADEHEPAVLAVVLGLALRQRRPVRHPAPDDAVAEGQPPVEAEGVARVRAADVRAERAAQAVAVAGPVPEVVGAVGGGVEGRVGLVRRRHQR